MADSVKNDDLSRTANLSDHESHSHSKQPLPSIHPDDARDKVFTAIMKALLKVGNKPSSPRELSNVITKYKYATLGGATPFATVSSRISQHFKRAAEHNPPRAPLLAKHVDQRHARKINYSLITDTIQSESTADDPEADKFSKTTKDSEKPEHYTRSSARKAELSDSSPLSSEDEGKLSPEIAHNTRSVDKRKRSVTKTSPPEIDKSTARSQRPRRKTNSQYARKPESEHDADEENTHESDHDVKPPNKRLRNTVSLMDHTNHLPPSSNQVAPTSPSLPPSIITDPLINIEDQEGADSDSEFSDYHEEMLKGVDVMEDVMKDPPTSSLNDKKNSIRRTSLKNTQTGTITSSTSITSIDTAIQSSQPTLSSTLNPSHTSPKSSPRLMGRKSQTNLLGDDLWLPYSFDQDFDNVFLSDNSCVAHHVPLNIAPPESISVSELDNYFSSTTSGSRKPFMNSSRKPNGCTGDFKGSPLLQKVLQAKQPMTVDNGARPQAGVTEDHKPDQSEVEAMALDEPTSDSNPALETPDDSSIDSSDEDAFQPARPYHIVEKVFGTLRVYELDSPGDIPNTKVMRFIGTTDGSNNNVARRTRNAETKSQKNSQYFYLDEGYVNATQLRKAAQPVLGKGTFDASTENERSGVVVTISTGPAECRGAWIPLNRARELVEEYEIESSLGLTKLLSDEPISKESQANGQLEGTNGTVSTPPSPRSLENESQRRSSPLATNSALVADSSEELSSEHISSDDDDSFVKFEDAETTPTPSLKPAESVISPNIAPDVVTSVATSVPPSKGPTTPVVNTTASLVSAMTTSPATAAAVAAASSNVNSTLLSAVEILKTLNISNLNLQTLHQIAAAIPNLAHLAPTLKSVSNSSTATLPLSKETKPQTPAALDIKSALSHFSTLEALLKKEPSKSPSISESAPTSPSSKPSVDASNNNSDQPSVIATTIPTTPHMYITIIDNIAVYVTVLSEANGVEGEHLLMRRLDNGYINGTTLLKAGGIETEQERSIVLSLEVGRVRIPNRASKLHGTWIPLRRAQALAATCSLQHKLGPFLNDSIDSYFPNPLPISLPVSKKPAESRLTAVTLTSLRNGSGSSKNGLLAHHASAPSSPNGTANAQLQQLLLSHPNKSLKLGDHSLKAPMLGSFDDDLPTNNKKGGHKKKKREISVVSCSNHCGGIASPNTSVLSPVTVKSGPTSDTCPSPPLHNLPTPDNDAVSPSSFVDVVNEEASDEDTDTDTDVEEVREHMKKMRAAAIDAMENGSSVDLDEIISRARSPLAYHRESHSQSSRRSQRSKRHRSTRHVEEEDDEDDDEDDEDDEEDEEIPISRPRRTHSNIYQSSNQSNRVNTYGRRRPTGGKWASGGKLAPSMVKKSASWNGPISKSSHIVVPSRRSNATKASDAPAARKPDSTPTKLTLIVPSPVSNKPSAVIEEDEDEEIDIGGSDRDDDLR